MKNSTNRLAEAVLNNKLTLDEFETYTLIPELKGRLEYYGSEMRWIVEKCLDPQTLFVATPVFVKLQQDFESAGIKGFNGEQAAKDFFGGIKSQIENEIIPRIHSARDASVKVQDYATLSDFVQKTALVSGIFSELKDELFAYQLHFPMSLIQTDTGKVMSYNLLEIDVVAGPFKVRLASLARSASSTMASIGEWKKSRLEQKNVRLNFLAQRTQLDANNKTLWIQVMTIILAFALSAFFLVATDPFQLLQKNQKQAAEIEALELELKRVQEQSRPAAVPSILELPSKRLPEIIPGPK